MPENKDIEVSDDYIILEQVMTDANLTAKWLAGSVGRSLVQCYRYLSGEATIPSVVWRAVYAKTRDERICSLFLGDVPVAVVDLLAPDQTPLEQCEAPTLKQISRQRKIQLEVEEAVLDLISAGQIDKKHAAIVERFKRNHSKAIATQIKIYMGIVNAFERSSL